ncbi:MAG TPA: hypothetical protein VF310_01105 [Vicinamibacteria bacterium]
MTPPSPLEETLAALGRGLPALTPRLAELVAESGRLERAAHELLLAFGEKRAAAERLAERAREALARLSHVGAEQMHELEAAGQAAEAGLARFGARLAAAEQALRAQAQATGGALEALAGQLAEARGRARRAREAAAAAGAAGADPPAGLAELQRALLGATAQAARVGTAGTEAAAAVDDELSALAEALGRLQDEGGRSVAGALGGFRARQSAHQRKLDDAADELAAGRASLLDELHRGLSQEVQARLGAAVESAALALEGLGDEARGAAETLTGARRELEAELEALHGVKRPLPAAVKQVRVAAERVGVRWA